MFITILIVYNNENGDHESDILSTKQKCKMPYLLLKYE